MDNQFSHFDSRGNAVMVDVTEKEVTERTAVAKGSIIVNKEVLDLIKSGEVTKGDVLGVARVAGIMAIKRTGDLIPMCHPLMLTGSSIDFTIEEAQSKITVTAVAKLYGKTGVEMEALTGATVALLTIYDMCKAVDKNMEITEVYLAKKTGGKSGNYRNPKEK
ncbi:cyclic pyranopterin monophosphate synthase MoaC [Anaerocolumna sp. AGMB13025]|uniref:cyclic pyranopterin monophosphate synthase MoaC n=1 Tax=Anaerocolumna sp. AGMB13025 TaxID=3039116 RepID=UPI00241D8CA8|nr:cyclic pyranopterin monophosphate synthase MoaC [Anaerocolumna sp. AGMB13025]WFR57938.1 cyclic pyranopterin monophosphate synthase MoaC [Anaerocolumna sp. AGMB13025]